MLSKCLTDKEAYLQDPRGGTATTLYPLTTFLNDNFLYLTLITPNDYCVDELQLDYIQDCLTKGIA